MVQAYVATDADPALYEFLQHDFNHVDHAAYRSRRHDLPEFPVVPAALHGSDRDGDGTDSADRAHEAAIAARCDTADDLQMRQFLEHTSRRLTRKGAHQAA